MSDESLRRIEELEVRVAFQDDLLATLNRVVADFDRELGRLRAESARMQGALDGLRAAQGHDVRDEPPPPHY